MATLFKSEIISELDNKINELDIKIDLVKKDEQLSKNTRQTRAYNLRKECRALSVMKEFIKLIDCDEINLKDDYVEWYKSLIALSSERTLTKVVVCKGDKLMDLLNKYQDVKDPFGKIQKACADTGLVLNMATGIVE